MFSDGDLIIERGDRVSLVGINGAGKSTMIKILAGAEPVTSGEYILGHNAQPDYFAQDQYKELDQNARMIDDLATVAPRATNTELRSILGCFLFSEDDVFKPIGVLSGGERNRYALARMLMVPSNFMLLDEPTNHLDMRAKDVLLDRPAGVQRYRGVRLARPLLHRQTGHARGGSGGRPASTFTPATTRTISGASRVAGPLRSRDDDAPAAPRRRRRRPSSRQRAEPAKAAATRLNPIKLRQMKERSHAIEDEITRLEVEIADYEAALGNFVNVEETKRVTELLEARRADLEALMMEWEDVAQLIEANS